MSAWLKAGFVIIPLLVSGYLPFIKKLSLYSTVIEIDDLFLFEYHWAHLSCCLMD